MHVKDNMKFSANKSVPCLIFIISQSQDFAASLLLLQLEVTLIER